MSEAVITSYSDEGALPYFFCPGCGHGLILDRLNEALVELQIDPHKVVIVTDIGCSGLSDQYFVANAFHGLHGRSITYATGIKLANPDLKVIVLMGDGGCGIGGHHLINAARRNIGITVVVFNNLNYGMTGGEHSVATPPGGITNTTSYGQLERPMDICGTAAVNGGSFVARTTAFDKGLAGLLAQAIQNEGFSLLDVWELCTAYYVPNNRFSRKALEETMLALNMQTGVIHTEARPEFSRAYRSANEERRGQPLTAPQPIAAKYAAGLERETRCMFAGAAGSKINTAAAAFCRAAVLSGLHATQRNDYPVTVKSGHSIAEVIVSPHEIGFTGITRPDILLVLFEEGLARVRDRIAGLTASDTLYINRELLPIQTQARRVEIDFKQAGDLGARKEYRAMMALALILRDTQLFSLEALREAVSQQLAFAEKNLAAIDSL